MFQEVVPTVIKIPFRHEYVFFAVEVDLAKSFH